MMRKNLIERVSLCLLALCLTFGSRAATRPLKVTVTNNSAMPRTAEMIELDAARIKKAVGDKFIVTFAGIQQPYQLTYDGKLIFQVEVSARSKVTYIIKKGIPEHFKAKANGHLHPERLDDMAWENDRIAYRCYGPALQRSGEKGFGNDVWLKRTAEMVCDFRYAQEENGLPVVKALRDAGKTAEAKHYQDSITYHIDHGTGLDNYDVGPTLGCGATAFLVDGQLQYPWCFSDYKVLDNGPLRFTVRLSYPLSYAGTHLTEVRVISLDAGSQLNNVKVHYEGQTTILPVAAGVVMHKGSSDCHYSAAEGYAGYAEKVKGNDGQTYVGLVFPNKVASIRVLPLSNTEIAARQSGAESHLIGLTELAKGRSLHYYWGAGWSKYGFPTPQSWYTYLHNFVQKLHSPLTVRIR